MPARCSLLTRALPNSILLEPPAAAAAVLRAILYADVFEFALTLDELQRYAAGSPAEASDVRVALESAWLAARVEVHGDLITLAGRGRLAEVRRRRSQHALRLWARARAWGVLLAYLPFVRMVAVTGALAMNNAQASDDDVDYVIVTAPGRVWLARAAAIAVVYCARAFGVTLCPNYLMDSDSLPQSQRDLFVAHELAQMVPLHGLEWYWQMRAANAWAHDFLPNARPMPRPVAERPRPAARLVQRALEALLGGRLGDRLERWERERKLRKFGPQLSQPGSAAVLDSQQVKGHFNDYGRRTLAEYEARCRRHGLDPCI